VIAGGPFSLDLVEWRSASFPSYGQVSGIADATQRTKVVKDLYNRFGRDYLWTRTRAGRELVLRHRRRRHDRRVPTAVASIPEDINVAAGPRSCRPASASRAPTDVEAAHAALHPSRLRRRGPRRVRGKIVGPSGSRKVWMRLTIEQQASAGRVPARRRRPS